MQAFEWTKLIVEEGVRPWANPMGRAAVRFDLLHDHRVSRPARESAGVIYLSVVAWRVWSGFYDRKGTYETVESCRALLALRGPGLGIYLCILLSLVSHLFGVLTATREQSGSLEYGNG